MKSRAYKILLAAVLAAGVLGATTAAEVRSDLVSPEKRRPAVELAARYAHPEPPAAMPADLIQPFNPPGFDQPDPEELRAIAAAKAAAAKAASSTPASTASTPVSRPANDRELLAHIASRIRPSGILSMGSDTVLIFGKQQLRSGDILTVTYDGQDYPLEITSVDRNYFTLRLNKEELTRPVKSEKNP